MKKVCLFILILLVLMTTSIVFASTAPFEVDIEGLAETAGNAPVTLFEAAGYEGLILKFSNIGSYKALGEIDLSKYDTCTILYGADGLAEFFDDDNNAFLALTTTGATTDGNYKVIEGVNIVSKVNLENPDGAWAAGSTEVVMNFESDYNGQVYLAFTMAKIGTHQDGIAITDIIFSNSKDETPEPTATEEPIATEEATVAPDATIAPTATKAPEKDTAKDGSALPFIISGIVAAAIVVVIVLIIKKKK